MMNRIKKIVHWIVFELSGINFIRTKIRTPSEMKNPSSHPSTIVIWLFGIYLGAFGLAHQRYETEKNELASRSSIFLSQLGPETSNAALAALAELQNVEIPLKPDLFSPTSIVASFVKREVSKTNSALISEALEITLTEYRKIAGAKLRGINLNNTEIKFVEFRNTELIQGKFESAYLGLITFRDSKLNDISFIHTNLESCRFFSSDLSEGDFNSSIIIRAKFGEKKETRSKIYKGIFSGSYIRDSDLSHTLLNESNFSNSILVGVDFNSSVMKNTIFNGAHVEQAEATKSMKKARPYINYFTDADMEGSSFRSSILPSSNFSRADLLSVDFSNSDLRNSNFSYTGLRRTNLVGSILIGANFDYSDFSGERAIQKGEKHKIKVMNSENFVNSNLTNATFRFADLSGVNFNGAILKNADLTGACLFNANLKDAKELTLKQLLSASTLHGAKLDEIMEIEVMKLKKEIFKIPSKLSCGVWAVTN